MSSCLLSGRAVSIIVASALALAACDETATPDPLEPAMRVYVSGEDGRLHVFDLETFERVASVDACAGASEVHATADGRTVWTICSGAASVAFVDTETLEVTPVAVGAAPVHSFLEPGHARLWVGNDGSGDVSVIELDTLTETRVLTGNGHHKIAFAPDASGGPGFAYVSNISDATISVIDATPALISNVMVGPAPHGIDCSAEMDLVYNCSGDDENSIEVIDPAQHHEVVSRIPLPSRCGYIHVEPDGLTAFATLGDMDLLARIDLETEEVTTFPAGAGPDKFEILGERAFVANVGAATVTVIDLDTSETRDIAVGMIHPDGDHGHRGIRRYGDLVFVPNGHDNSVSVIDVESETVIATLEGIPHPSGIAIAGPDGGTAYPR